MTTLRAAVYARISSDVVGEGLGVQRQQDDCRALAARRGWPVVDTYVDNDVSAYSGKRRPEYERLLTDVLSGRVTGIVVWHPDRLHRSPVELENFITVVESTGCMVATVQAGELDLTTPAGRMTARIVGAVARGESEHKSARIRRKLEQNAVDGRHHGGERPFGWNEDRTTANPPEANVVAGAVAAVAHGASLRGIARDLNAAGLTNRDGGPWTETTIRNMVVRPRNVAIRTYKGEVVGAGKWESIVDRDSWDEAIRVLSNPARRSALFRIHRHLLSGIALCCTCGDRVRVSNPVDKRGNRRAVYRCPQGHVSRSQEHVDELVTAVVLARLAMPDAAEAFAPVAPVVGVDYAADAQTLRLRLADAAEDYADGVLTRAQLRAVTERLRPQIDHLEALVPASPPDSPVVMTLATAADVAEEWSALTVKQQKAVIDVLVVVTIELSGRGPKFDPESVRIEWRVES